MKATPIDDDIIGLLTTPIGFVERLLGLELYPWQDTVLSWFEETSGRTKGTLSTPNGAGKSQRIVAGLALWWVTVHPKGRVVITTKDSKQLDNQVWPSMVCHKAKFPTYRFIQREIHTPTGGFIIGFTTDEPGRAEGWHKLDDMEGPLLIIIDEAKSVPDPIFSGIDRCGYNAILYVSSPGLTQGRFYDSHTKTNMGFKSLRAGLKDCPHIPKEKIADIIATYGQEHPFTQSTLYGEFMDTDSESEFVIPRAAVRMLMESPPTSEKGAQSFYLDFAAGGAENVIAHRIGNTIQPLVCWRDANPVASVGRFIMELNRRHAVPSEVYGDAAGMGSVMIPLFHEMGWLITGINGASPARKSERYLNLAAEMWWEARLSIEQSRIVLPDDEVLTAQLCTRKTRAKLDPKGRLGVESKEDMAKRNMPSPDRADAVCGVMSIEFSLASALFDALGLRRVEALSRTSIPEFGAIDRNGNSLVYHNISLAPWITVWERPITGCSYLAVLNPARHSEPGNDHTFIVLREGFTDPQLGTPRNLRMVARLSLPCRMDAGPLAELVARICQWYGEPMVVPIVNDRGDVTDALLAAGISLYHQEDFETLRHGKRAGIRWGWETTEYTRSLWISALAEYIRENRIDIEDPRTVMQLGQLTAENADTMRDAEAVGVGLKCLGYASRYLPRDTSPLASLSGGLGSLGGGWGRNSSGGSTGRCT